MKTSNLFILTLLLFPSFIWAQIFNETYDFSTDYSIDKIWEDDEGFTVRGRSNEDILIFRLNQDGQLESSFNIPLVDPPTVIPTPAYRIQYNGFIHYDLTDNAISLSRWNGVGDFLWTFDYDFDDSEIINIRHASNDEGEIFILAHEAFLDNFNFHLLKLSADGEMIWEKKEQRSTLPFNNFVGVGADEFGGCFFYHGGEITWSKTLLHYDELGEVTGSINIGQHFELGEVTANEEGLIVGQIRFCNVGGICDNQLTNGSNYIEILNMVNPPEFSYGIPAKAQNIDAAGTIPAAGIYDGHLWFSRANTAFNTEWINIYDFRATPDLVQQCLDGGYILAGESEGQLWVMKTDELGNSIPKAVCLQGLTFNKQEELDDFNNNCTIVEGDLIVEGPDIADVSKLEKITDVQGSLRIGANELTSISGLSDIQYVRENVIIFARQLATLSPLKNLNFAEAVEINSCFALQNLGGLSGLKVLTSFWLINHGDGALESLEGLHPEAFFESVNIIAHPHLTDLSPLAKLSFHNLSLAGGADSELTSLTGLENLTELPGNLHITYFPLLADISALNNLQKIGGNFQFVANDKMINLDGLNQLNAIDGKLILKDNSKLSDCCAIEPLLKNMNVQGEITIENNLPNCNTEMEILEACTPVSNQSPSKFQNLDIYPNPASNGVYIDGLADEELNLQLFNIYGKKLRDQTKGNYLNVNDIPAGNYFLKVLIEEEYIIRKITIVRPD